MPLRTPILDDRSFAQLRDELIARIPVYAPQWTDRQPSDPGITLIELFAFLGENLLYRFNQIPDATRQSFLDLLQVPLRPAAAAATIVAFGTDQPAGILIPGGAALTAGKVPFTTVGECHAWPVTARPAIRARVDEQLDVDTLEYLARSSAAQGASVDDVLRYRTVFGATEPARPGGDRLDPAGSVDGTLYLALVTPTPPDPTTLAGRELSIGFVPSLDVPTMADVQPCPGEGQSPPAPPMRWQVCTTDAVPNPPLPDSADPVWLDLPVAGDTTSGLLTSGVVRLQFPSDPIQLARIGVYLPIDPDAIGSGDQPPLIEDEALDAQLIGWLRVFRPDGSAIGAMEWAGANAARAEQTETARAEFLGTGTGEPDQQYRLAHPQVIGSLTLDVEEQGAGRWVPWTQVDDFGAAGPDDRVFTIDAEAGTVRFGEVHRGRAPQIGERIRVRGYTYGGGAAGNVGAAAISAVPQIAKVTVANPLPATGGAEPQTIAEAIDQIPAELARRDRAVTVSDFRELAEATPGAGIIRAETLRLFDPQRPDQESPGVVSVVVWPEHDRLHPDAPRPDRGVLEQVCHYLDPRRLITTEVYVIPPTYRRIAVSVGIAVRPGYGAEGVRRWVDTVLHQYLSPVPPYGPEGHGWPLGRPVFGPELEAAALQVEGLEFLSGLRVSEDVDGEWVERTAPVRVDLDAWEVPELVALTVTTGDPVAPGSAQTPVPPAGPPVPVRSPREVCR
ncbi:putative baseplate assembly protein [Kribbella pratensis]|uniref:Phage baseplate assembly protein n=1 Tax=Kribbella pratensis TaxID=2512112 RepID=A0A4R8CM49_9ACTN|nr:putative baseplate assembly protein [Kribbella pratensis]TDW77142.1 putative phage baseplate assembly protein [Kribbella pratensis]